MKRGLFGGQRRAVLRHGNNPSYTCTANGGAGNDTIEGSYRVDIVDGGPGDDTIDGGRGTDTCQEFQSEKTVNCEKR